MKPLHVFTIYISHFYGTILQFLEYILMFSHCLASLLKIRLTELNGLLFAIPRLESLDNRRD
jgi:hypothetical protein